MDEPRKLELLQQQIDEANDGNPSDFELWRQKTDVVLRNVLGDASPLYQSFVTIQYSLSAWTSGTPKSTFAAARVLGVQKAIAVLRAAQLEVEVAGGAPDGSVSDRAVGRSIFIVHGQNDARKHEVARFVRSLTGNDGSPRWPWASRNCAS